MDIIINYTVFGKGIFSLIVFLMNFVVNGVHSALLQSTALPSSALFTCYFILFGLNVHC